MTVAKLGERAVAIGLPAQAQRLEDVPADVVVRLVPLLDGSHTVRSILGEMERTSGFDAEEVLRAIDQLVSAGLVRGVGPPLPGPDEQAAALLALGVGEEVVGFLRRTTIGVVGLGPAGRATAMDLVRYQIGRLVLVGRAEEAEDLASWISAEHPQASVSTMCNVEGYDSLKRATEACAVLVHCDTRPATDVAHWVNRVALETQTVAAFGWAEGPRATLGPIVFPGESPCLLCWRMRSIACMDDFEAAMALEEQRRHASSPSDAPALPGAISTLAGYLATEIVKVLTGLGSPRLVGRVADIDMLSGQHTEAIVLPRADCPACGGRSLAPRRDPGATQQGPDSAATAATDPAVLRGVLVDGRQGVIRSLDLVHKDPLEPERPYVLRAELANHRFLAKEGEAFVICSGKGMTTTEAMRSAIGEAIERYSGYSPSADHLRVGRREDLDMESLDPARLVLYADHQYSELPYSRWDPDAEIGWTGATDAATGERVAVPAMSVYLGYQPLAASEYLFPLTSNGLAAGPSIEAAMLAAALEVIERDALMTAWLARLPVRRLDPASVGDAVVDRICELYGRRGVDIELYALPTDLPVHVVASLGVSRTTSIAGLPALVMGLGADFDGPRACAKAVSEVGQIRPALRLRLRSNQTSSRMEELVADPGKVSDIDDHSLLFADPRMLPAMEAWRNAPLEGWDQPDQAPEGVRDRLDLLTAHLAIAGSRLLTVDVTPADMASLGIFTARAILPDYQPIHFGAREARLGGCRLFNLPSRLGLRPAALPLGEINLLPHPLA